MKKSTKKAPKAKKVAVKKQTPESIVKDTMAGYELYIDGLESKGFLTLQEMGELEYFKGGSAACRFILGRLERGE